MGSCISKCRARRKRPLREYFDHSNHVVSHTPSSPANSVSETPTTSCQSSSSCSSFSCSTQSVSTTGLNYSLSSLSSSCSSSVLSSKDPSFSNEFLLSCARKNPQIICFDEPPLKNRLTDQAKRFTKQERMDNPRGSSKRARSNSPTLTRQKSFRVYQPEQRVNSNHVSYGGGRNNYMRSPSPSRRFSGDSSYYNQRANFSMSSPRENSFKHSVTTKRENVRPASLRNVYGAEDNGYLKNQEKRNVGDLLVGVRSQVTAKVHNLEHAPIEDIDNPLIALDCFIFL